MKNALITRSIAQSLDVINIFSKNDIFPFCLPMIELVAVTTPKFKHTEYDLCILTSPSAVKFYTYYHFSRGLNASKFIAIGYGTALTISMELGIPYDDIVVPEAFYLSEMMDKIDEMDLKDKKVLAPGAKVRIADITSRMIAKGADFDRVDLYETKSVYYPPNYIDEFMQINNINILTFYSPSAVNSFFSHIHSEVACPVFAIGKTTAKELIKYGIKAYQPHLQTTAAMAIAINEYFIQNEMEF